MHCLRDFYPAKKEVAACQIHDEKPDGKLEPASEQPVIKQDGSQVNEQHNTRKLVSSKQEILHLSFSQN
ncbi:MAG: hypothetical protein HY645_06670 [Acidobacteria bacterium]|nr:hypothetical protein [Acidobacteriota bacterium]